MVYIVTMNPSLDYIMYIDKLNEGLVNRSVSERIVTGGKGINVSYVLSQLDIPSVILGFTAGFTGEYIKQEILRTMQSLFGADFIVGVSFSSVNAQ